MKKILFTLATLSFFSSVSHAQLHKRRDSFVGVKAGGSAASFAGELSQNKRYVYGFNAGFFANLPINSIFSVQPELLYSMKGVLGQAGVSDESIRLNYIDLPVALRANLEDLFVEAGPQLGYLLTAKSSNAGESLNVRPAYRSLDFGYLLGVGYQPKKGGLGIGGRYNAGFLSVYKDPIDGTDAAEVYNGVFQVYLTYSAQKYHKYKKRSSVR